MASLRQYFEGLMLRLAAEVVGARVTSWIRTLDRNRAVGGHPNSYHLWGGAVDVGAETTSAQRAVLRRFAREVDETDKPGAPHYHYQVDGRGLPLVGGFLACLALWWGFVRATKEGEA